MEQKAIKPLTGRDRQASDLSPMPSLAHIIALGGRPLLEPRNVRQGLPDLTGQQPQSHFGLRNRAAHLKTSHSRTRRIMPIGDRDRKIRVRQRVIALKRGDKPCVFRKSEHFPASAIIRIFEDLKYVIPRDQRRGTLRSHQSFIIKLRQQAL